MPSNSLLKKRIIVLHHDRIMELNNVYGPILSPFWCDLDIIRFMISSGKRVYEVLPNGDNVLLTTSNYTYDFGNGELPPPEPPAPTEEETFALHIKQEFDSEAGLHHEIRFFNNRFQYYKDELYQWIDVVADDIYTDTEPTEYPIGGLKTLSVLAGKTMDQILYRIFHGVAEPIITFIGNPMSAVYEKGLTIPSIVLTANITKGETPITSIKFYKDDVLINSPTITPFETIQIVHNYTSPINTDATFKLVVNDGVTDYVNEIKYKFAYPIIIGTIDENDSLTPANIINNGSSLLLDMTDVNTINFNYTSDGKKLYIAHHSSLELNKIIDPNELNLINSFDETIVAMVMADNQSANYSVRVLENICFVNDYKLIFKFNEN